MYLNSECKKILTKGGNMSKNTVNEKDDNNYMEHYQKYDGLWGETLSQYKNRLVYRRRSKDMICIYCGENAQTREHCPPKSFFLEHDFPDNLRVLPACEKCNKGFSHDEEIVRDYLNCTYDRFFHKVSERDYSPVINEDVEWTEKNRWPVEVAERIFLKVAQGLAIYELSDCFGDYGWIPKVSKFICKHWVSQKEWASLDEPIVLDVFPELGTRASNELFIIQMEANAIAACVVMWTELKENVFSYVTWMQDDVIRVRMILRDFYYVEVDFYREDLI